ncbi:MAG: hypothetical protein AAGG38_05575 [Planctomycetota bacterium]
MVKKIVTGMFAASLCAGSASAAVTIIEDFQGFTAGDNWTAGGWVETTTAVVGTSNTVIAAGDPGNLAGNITDSGEAYVISSPTVPDDSLATIAFDIAALDLAGDVIVGLAVDNGSTTPNINQAVGALRLVNGDLQAFGGNGLNSPSTGSSYEADTQYTVWSVINTTANTFDLWILGGAFATQTQIADDAT